MESEPDGKFYFSCLSCFIDLCVVHPSAPSYLSLAGKALGAASKREKDKTLLYGQAAQTQGALFYPLVLESFGALGSRGIEFLSKLADEASSNGVAALEDVKVKQYIFRSLSFTLQFMNAIIMSNGSRLSRAKLGQV